MIVSCTDVRLWLSLPYSLSVIVPFAHLHSYLQLWLQTLSTPPTLIFELSDKCSGVEVKVVENGNSQVMSKYLTFK